MRPIVWVCAPPGTGKTTLVASYLEARGLRYLWYQCDVGDADTATFVHYVRTAAQQIAGKAADALPLFGAEPQQDLARFARGFFRDLFSALPHPCAVVFDNFHEPRTRPEQRAAFVQGLDEVPEGITVIVLSRADPPAEFARLVASRRIARVGEAALRCTSEESEAILGKPHLAAQQLQRFQQQSDGWMAALVLLREHLSRNGATLDDSLGEGEGHDLPVLRGRDLQRGTARKPARADADGDSAVDNRGRGRRAHRHRGSAAFARVPVSPAPVHRSAPRRAIDLSLPHAVS